MKHLKTKDITLMAMFVAVLCICAYISIPISIAHITLLNFFICLIGALFPVWESTLIVLVYLLIGTIGLPVFIGGNAGIGYLFGLTGGYSLAFLAAVILIGLLKGKTYHRTRYTIVIILSVLLVDFLGMLQWMIIGNLTLKTAFFAGFLPFLPLDLLKAVIAAQIVPAFRRLLYRQS